VKLKLFTGMMLLLFLSVAMGSDQDNDQSVAKKIVSSKCHLCHGMEGEGSSAIYPRLAGQHKTYLIKQQTDFRDGTRTGTMSEMAFGLTDEEISALADYFSSKPPAAHKVRDQEFAGVGRYIFTKGNRFSGVAACVSCHGENGEGNEQMPRLAGQHKRYVASQLMEFNSRKRTNDNSIMHSIASKLTELEIHAVAQYVSGLR